ncbi:uncharacterized protein LOC112574763 isoform X2 [Pomacea canaliculata]|uniref:uncharacterized protein LOC112574763 isoform X2 n=1 Tax=Pomacea canaliculata TaxID=400727 RepID=UPI000D73199C|nr:uncharacterized protein LOC112574763 isoform X2 [Pomacea canaliculata]
MISEDLNSKHNFCQDRQLQNNLLAADDTFQQVLQGDTPFSVSVRLRPNIPDKVCEVTGWCPNGKIVLRKPENDIFSKPKTAGGAKDQLQDRVWRDPRLRRDQIHESSFVFHHYHDSHMYIEQYRKEHSCLSKSQSLSDYQIKALNNARTDHISDDNTPQTLSNMPKKDQTPHLSPLSILPSEPGPRRQKIKVTPVITPIDGNISTLKWPEDSDIVSTSIFHQCNCSARRVSSAATSKIPASKVTVKMSSPAALTISPPSVLKLLRFSKKTRGSRGSWNANSEFKTPTLARIENKVYKEPKEEDRDCEDQAALQEEPKVMEVASMSPCPHTPGLVARYHIGDKAVDMMEMDANGLPKCQLSREPSCQCEWLLQSFMLATNSVPLRPFRPEMLYHSQTMFGYLQPNSVARTEQHTHGASEKGFEMSEPYNYLKQIIVSSKGYAPQVHGGLKGTTTKPDLPATFQLLGMSKQCHSSTQKVQALAQNSTGRRQKGRLFRRTTTVHEVRAGDPQTQLTRPATVSGEAGRHSCHELASSSCVTQMPTTSYLKFWNSRMTADVCNKKNFMKWESAKSSMDPQDLLELNPAQKARVGTKQQNPHSNQLAGQATPVANAAFGVASPETPIWFDSNGRAYVSLATRYEPIKK